MTGRADSAGSARLPLQLKIAVVSGASSGVGKAVALVLAETGCEVIAFGRRDAVPAEFSDCPQIRYVSLDFGSRDLSGRLREALAHVRMNVDILVNCAGHDRGGGIPFDEQDEQVWQDTIAVNLSATMSLTQACLPGMVARKKGDIVFVGSISTKQVAPLLTAYAASKHAIHGFAEVLRKENGKSGIRVIEVIPGAIRSGFAEARWYGDASRAQEFYDGFPDCLMPEDVAGTIAFALAQPLHVTLAEIVMRTTREI